MRGAGVADLRVGDAVTDGDDASGELQRAHHLGLAAGLRERAGCVEARHHPALPLEVVAVDALGRNAELRAHGLHVLAESARDHVDAVGVAAHRRDVLAERRAEPALEELDHRVHVRATDGEHGKPAPEADVDADRAAHAVAGDGLDGLHRALALRVVGQRDARELVEALEGDDGAVEVEDQLDRLRVGGDTGHRGSCVGALGRRVAVRRREAGRREVYRSGDARGCFHARSAAFTPRFRESAAGSRGQGRAGPCLTCRIRRQARHRACRRRRHRPRPCTARPSTAP